MKKIILSSLLATSFLFSSDNLVIIIENNSLLKIGKNEIKSSVDGSSDTIYNAYKNKTFKNYSPYWFDQYIGTYDTSPTVITMVGEKSIQYGSIYSKGFGKKFNINTLGVLVTEQQYSLALKILDTFNKNDLIYTRSRLNVYDKSFFSVLENYIKTELDSDAQTRYLNRLEYIYDILELTNNLYDKEISMGTIPVLRPNLFNYQAYLQNPTLLSATTGKITSPFSNEERGGTTENQLEYVLSGNILTRYCAEPYQIREESYSSGEDYSTNYIIDYRIKKVASIDLSKPIPLNTMYLFKYGKCATTDKKKWYPKISNPSLPSSSAQKIKILSEMKQLRNGGSYLTKMKNLYSSISSDSNIKSTLTRLSNRSINNGKIIHVNYGLAEGLDNGKLIAGIVKNVSMGTIFHNKVNFIMNEGFIYDINNPPSYFVDKTGSLSEASKEDTTGNKFNTLYYVVNQKLESNVPEKANFQGYSNLIPSGSKVEAIKSLYGGEVLWLADNEGKYIPDFKYNNNNEILIDSEDSLDVGDLMVGMKNYARSQIDTLENASEFYPMNFKGIIFKYVPKNTKDNGLKYFGPRFDAKMYMDKYTQIIKTTVPLDCSKETCTDAQKAMTNPTKEETKEEIHNYCGIEFNNPDTPTYQYYVFENIFNRIVEEPFGDIQVHAHKDQEIENNEIFVSEQSVPKIFKYIGEVEDEAKCIELSNLTLESTLQTKLESNNVLNFDFSTNVDSLDTLASSQFGEQSNKMTVLIDEFLINKSIYTKNLEITPTTNISGESTYEDSTQDTILSYYNHIKSLNPTSSGKVNNIDTTIILKSE